MRDWTFTIADRPTCENEHRKMHYRTRAAHDRQWRDWANITARVQKLPRRIPAVEIVVVHERRNRVSLPDVAGCAPTAKAVIDGLVDYGLITHDGPDILRRLSFEVRVTGRDALTLNISEVTP